MEKRFCPYCMCAVEAGEPCPNCGLTAGAYNPLPHHLPPGTVLMDRYLVGRVLGEGGFGITYIGCDLRLELKVAIKEYFPTDKVTRHAMASLTVSSYIGAAASGYEAGKERFLSEARAMARMDKQPQIVSVRDFFEANNTAYIVMEYVEGTTFKELVSQKGGKIPPTELLPMMEPLFFALSAMHERGLIHRDISPDNLMLENGALRLLDFGCARESSRGTETMTIALKHGYAPIEQYQHKGQGPWTDVYGLSATIYYCLTGKTPPQALDRLCEDELMLPRKLGVPLSERQEKALLYGMGIRPRRRFQSVEELHTALYEEQVPIPQPPETEPEQGLLEEPVREFIKVTPPQAEVKPGDKTVVEPLFEPATVPEPAPQPEHRNTWQPESQPVAAEQPAAVAVMEAEPAQEGSLPTRLTRNKKILAIGGIAAAVVIVAVVLLAVLLPGGDDPAAESHLPATSPSPVVTDEPGGRTVTLTGGTDELSRRFLEALADHSVSSIVVPGNMGAFGVPGNAVTITKPVLVQEGTELDFIGREVSVTGNGSLLIEGLLAVDQAFIFSDGGRLEVTRTGALMGDGLLWFDSEEDCVLHEGAVIEMEPVHFIFGDPEALFADVLEATSELDLRRAQQWGRAAVIPSGTKITLTQEFTQLYPVLIEEGAEVVSGEDCAWAVYQTLLINRGTLSGWIWVGGGEDGLGQLVNQGVLDATEAFFLLNGSTLFNQPSGEVVLHSIPQFSEGTYTLNLGTITGHVELLGGMMLNRGAIVNTNQDGLGFDISPGSRFVNRPYGTVDIYGNFWNDGYIFNAGGTVTIHDGAGFDNCSLFETEGALYLGQNNYVGNSGIVRWIAGNGYVDQPERLDHLIYDNSRVDWNNGMDIVEISTADELTAWAKREDSAATLTQDITVEGELHITTSMEIPEGVTLTVDRLTISGTTVRVGGVLDAHEVHVLDGALLHANGNISVRDGGLFELDNDSSLIYEGNDFDLSGSTLRLANGSDFYLAWAEHAEISYVEVLSDAHFLSLNGGVLEGAEVMVQGGQLLFPHGMGCNEVDLTIEEGGLRANGLDLEAGSLIISVGNLLTSGNVRLGGGVTMVNHGQVNFGGYEDKHLVQIDGVIENHGTLVAGGLPIEVYGQLDNYGTLYYAWGGSITGNVTGDPAQPHPDSE